MALVILASSSIYQKWSVSWPTLNESWKGLIQCFLYLKKLKGTNKMLLKLRNSWLQNCNYHRSASSILPLRIIFLCHIMDTSILHLALDLHLTPIVFLWLKAIAVGFLYKVSSCVLIKLSSQLGTTAGCSYHY